MKRYLKSIVAALLLVAIIISSYIPTFAVGQPSTYSKSYNSGERDVVCTTLNGTSASKYYTGNYTYDNLDNYTGTALYSQLQTLMRSTHSYISTYDDCHYKADKTDCENENGKVVLIYTSYSATQSQWNGWNREHVWPKSLGGNNTTGGGADMHHIRPSDAVVNSTRGSKKYGNADGGKAVYGSNPASGVLGGYSGTFYEPLDNVKGDVARICLYVYVRWGSSWGADNITKVFQSVDVLLEWCAMDPVDTWEMGRNEVVQAYQGNRNVFIDYPELAWLLFNKPIPTNMTTPSGEAANGNSGNQGGGNTGGDPVITPCKHTSTEIRGAVAATCNTDGYSGDTYCKSCGEKLSSGSQIPSTGKHTYGEWELLNDGTYGRSCSVCGAVELVSINGLVASLDNEAEKILILLSLGVSDSSLLDLMSTNR